jgi:tRNA U38,U39,U40 pseudouridine synthase TruA
MASAASSPVLPRIIGITPSYQVMSSVSVGDDLFRINFVRCEVVVESFILNPTRKMVGVAARVMRKIVGSFAAGE